MKKWNISYRVQGVVLLTTYPNTNSIRIIDHWVNIDIKFHYLLYPIRNQSGILYMDIVRSVYQDE